MKSLSLALLALAAATTAHAEWRTIHYSLRGGWSGIWLHGDATHKTPSELFAAFPSVVEIWRWNPNPDAIRFTTSPAVTDEPSPEWTIWKRNDETEQKLSAMLGQSAYLVRCSGASSTSIQVPITQRMRPPATTWLVSGANFMGFPTASPAPNMAGYFGSFLQPITTPNRTYKYIGGELGDFNPMQISPSVELLDRNTAYWFEAQAVSDFTGPVKFEVPNSDGLAFGRALSIITIGLTNRTTSAITLRFKAESSEPAPTGQTPIKGPVSLRMKTSSTAQDVALTGELEITLPASGRADVQFLVDRSAMTGGQSDRFASLLKITDTAKLQEVWLPVSALPATPAGLWVGQIDVGEVVSNVPGSPGATTPRPFPLRTLIHVDGNGAARLLSQAFLGPLAQDGTLGVCVDEASLASDRKGDAMRLVSSHMPLDRIIDGSGNFAIGSVLSHVIEIPFNDPVNPFVHQYHPDHDNRDARLMPLPVGTESYHITRRCEFAFQPTPTDGQPAADWGTSTYGGNYTETISGPHKQPLVVRGSFVLRRISEVADLTLPDSLQPQD
jgi:hypothetical protein